ncbi:hypothetical protein SAMN04488112_10583 [Melghirimyces thermohalophilus]|uniref:Uncharacterized protein n=1 Tax=Melghirimyces thermohalophilus TaxID=1236220 RepID=A0A1G6K5H1_9BACL|nr:hypothetical protein SAMN04488112_10583 [Melghirimyces thermohalophilus]
MRYTVKAAYKDAHALFPRRTYKKASLFPFAVEHRDTLKFTAARMLPSSLHRGFAPVPCVRKNHRWPAAPYI